MDVAPLLGLRIRTARLELRLPSAEEIDELASVAEAGVHPRAEMPFAVPWTDGVGTPSFRADFADFHRSLRADWRPDSWTLALGVFCDRAMIGSQGLGADAFAERREVDTGSWLGGACQGRGYGTEMRAAVLHLAFAGLGARTAWSGAFAANPASARVSEKLGYAPAGEREVAPRGVPVTEHRFRLDAATWWASDRIAVELAGLEPCLPLLGA
jgi:RimJ/RimL family protein N-acetyltransferase